MTDQPPPEGGAPAPEVPNAAEVVPPGVLESAAVAQLAPEAPAAPAVPAAPAAPAWVAPPPPAPPPAAPDAGWSQYVPSGAAPGPAAGWEYAGFWIRTVAYIIDGFILGVVTSILWIIAIALAGAIGFGAFATSGATGDSLTEGEVAVIGVGIFTAIVFLAIMTIVVTVLYFVLLWVKRGATLGQSLLGIRIARESDGGPIGWGTAIIRYIMMLISFWIFYLGVIWVAFEPRKRGWHDMVAGTLAVRRR